VRSGRGWTTKEATVPDSFGKRNRDVVKARKAAARDDRRIARNQRHRQGGVIDERPSLYRPVDQPPGETGATDRDPNV
jgi:hypothetical protein